MANVTHHIIVKGKVHGVFFRASTRKAATSLCLKGWVRNTANGDVEIIATGDAQKLALLEEWCRTGPVDAQVQDVVIDIIPEAHFESFTIRK